MSNPLRVALFTDSYAEANGVATLSRAFADFAHDQELPFCCVYGGHRTQVKRRGSLLDLELKRSWASFPMDTDLYCDLLLSRYRNRLVDQLGAFQPDLIHIMGPGDLGVLGFWVSNLLKVPMAASWHTNLHEYASRRLEHFLSFAPRGLRTCIAGTAQQLSLRALTGFYHLAHFVLAPNPTTVEMLGIRTGRPSYLMGHGVDSEFFSPARRTLTDDTFCIGYVGRLTPEKNVRVFVDLERDLMAAGQTRFRFLLAGEGSEREWLRRNLKTAELPGVLRGDCLAAAFAGMDVLVFPSRTDTFGLVMLEAMASGVPIVTNQETGVRAGVQHGVTGLLGSSFARSVLDLMTHPIKRQLLAEEARRFAVTRGWKPMFQDLYKTYNLALSREDVQRRMTPKPQCEVR